MHQRLASSALAALALVPITASPAPTPNPPAAPGPVSPPAPRGTWFTGDGHDGPFAPTTDVTIDLANQGTYDSQLWAVVFNYSSVNIPAGVTVTFSNHQSRAPVVWLVTGDVQIDGVVNLDGMSGTGADWAVSPEPGPGGFRGGADQYVPGHWAGGSGFGPGGGQVQDDGSGGSHATAGGGQSGPTYGSPAVFPLIGGSGGSADGDGGNRSGGAGGGAILIAAGGTVAFGNSGQIRARGGNAATGYGGPFSGAGSGGAIRIVADTIALASGSPPSGVSLLATGGGGPSAATAASGSRRTPTSTRRRPLPSPR